MLYRCEKQNISFTTLHTRPHVPSYVHSSDRFDPTLLDLSTVANHSGQYFNYADVPATAADRLLGSDTRVVDGQSLIFNRFHPGNLMHVLHDDLLPLYDTLKVGHDAIVFRTSPSPYVPPSCSNNRPLLSSCTPVPQTSIVCHVIWYSCPSRCPECGRVLQTRIGLISHLRTHMVNQT